jgi:hypothetical protein
LASIQQLAATSRLIETIDYTCYTNELKYSFTDFNLTGKDSLGILNHREG